jgi:hypothetical protein
MRYRAAASAVTASDWRLPMSAWRRFVRCVVAGALPIADPHVAQARMRRSRASMSNREQPDLEVPLSRFRTYRQISGEAMVSNENVGPDFSLAQGLEGYENGKQRAAWATLGELPSFQGDLVLVLRGLHRCDHGDRI